MPRCTAPSVAAATGSSARKPRPPLASLAPMGILDEAIREHLELKRSHGASDDEISRKEAEAFGPARSEVAAPAAPEAAPEEEHTQLLQPGDHAVPDPHDHLHPAGSDPAWGEDTEFFADQPGP